MNSILTKWKKLPLTVKVSSAYAICSIVQKCLSIITMPLFTRLLTTEQYGQYTIYQSWHSVLAIVITLNLAYGSFSTAMMKFEDDREGYISSIEGICLTLSLLFLIIYLPFRASWNQLFELPTPIVCIMVTEILFMTGVQFWSGQKRFEYKYKEVVGVTLLMSLLSPAAALLLVMNTEERGYARIIGYAAVNIAIGAFFLIGNIARGKKVFNAQYWKYAIGFNVPLLAYYFSQVIFNHSDRIMISHMVGKDKAAIYGVAYSLAMVLTFMLTAINNAYVPWLYQKIKSDEVEDNKAVSVGIILFIAVLLSAIIWFAPEIIMLMAGEKYSEAMHVIPPVAISTLLLLYSQLFINVEFYYEEKKSLVTASICAAIINVILNWIFIMRFGYYAAAYTTLASYLVFAFMNCVFMRKALSDKGKKDNAYSYRALVGIMIVFVAVSALGASLYNHIIIRLAITFCVLVILVIKREYFLSVYKALNSKELPTEKREM